MAWSSWRNLDELYEADYLPIPAKAGVYRIRLRWGSGCQNIDRILGTDSAGILYIGMTSNRTNGKLRWRIECFHRRANGYKGYPHSGGKAFVRYLRDHFKAHRLEVQWKVCASDAKAVEEEARLLRKYAKTFGELPPLNRKGGAGY